MVRKASSSAAEGDSAQGLIRVGQTLNLTDSALPRRGARIPLLRTASKWNVLYPIGGLLCGSWNARLLRMPQNCPRPIRRVFTVRFHASPAPDRNLRFVKFQATGGRVAFSSERLAPRKNNSGRLFRHSKVSDSRRAWEFTRLNLFICLRLGVETLRAVSPQAVWKGIAFRGGNLRQGLRIDQAQDLKFSKDLAQSLHA